LGDAVEVAEVLGPPLLVQHGGLEPTQLGETALGAGQEVLGGLVDR
jgi:hypothetical protein